MFLISVLNTKTGSCVSHTVTTLQGARRDAAALQREGRTIYISDRATGRKLESY